ncbi:MAG: MFS transporter [Dehalococcoidia bacterium]|nr:MFS transporter [Dehalococcoidia bacterium]
MTASGTLYTGWQRNLAFIWIGVFVGLMGANFVFPFIPFYIKELGVTDDSRVAFYTGLTGSATGLSLTLTAPLWGSLADRFGRKPMLVRALIGAGILIGLMGLAQTVWHLVLLRFMMGAFAGTMGAAAALVAATTPRERTGRALGILQTGVFSANMLGPFIGGVVAASLGIRESFIFCAVLYIVASGLVLYFVKEPNSPRASAAAAEAAGERPAPAGNLVANLREVLSEKQILVMLSFLFVLWLSTTFVRPVMPISVDGFASHPDPADDSADRVSLVLPGYQRELKEEAATGIVFGILGLTSTIAAISVSPVGERLGYRRTVCGAAMITGLLFLPVALAGGFTTFVLFLGGVGLFQGAMVPGTNALIAAATPEGKHGSAFGLASSMQSLALLIGPLAGGGVAGLFGIEAVYVVIGVILVGAAVLAFMSLHEPERGPIPEPALHGPR